MITMHAAVKSILVTAHAWKAWCPWQVSAKMSVLTLYEAGVIDEHMFQALNDDIADKSIRLEANKFDLDWRQFP